jgi:serine/threonine protein kinase
MSEQPLNECESFEDKEISHYENAIAIKAAKKIGKGGFGTVYKWSERIIYESSPDSSKDSDSDQTIEYITKVNEVAIKVIDISDNVSKEFIMNEIGILYQFRNIPGVSKIEDCHISKNKVYLKMNLLWKDMTESESQNKFWNKKIFAKLDLIKKLLSTLKKIHDLGYVHLDLKLSNILSDSEEMKELVIVDFGSTVKTGEHFSVLSKLYASPFVLMGDRTATKAHDMWSMGLVLATLLLKVEFNEGIYSDCTKKLYEKYLKGDDITPELVNKCLKILKTVFMDKYSQNHEELEQDYGKKNLESIYSLVFGLLAADENDRLRIDDAINHISALEKRLDSFPIEKIRRKKAIVEPRNSFQSNILPSNVIDIRNNFFRSTNSHALMIKKAYNDWKFQLSSEVPLISKISMPDTMDSSPASKKIFNKSSQFSSILKLRGPESQNPSKVRNQFLSKSREEGSRKSKSGFRYSLLKSLLRLGKRNLI